MYDVWLSPIQYIDLAKLSQHARVSTTKSDKKGSVLVKVRSIHIVSSNSVHNDTATQWRLFKKDDFLSTITELHANIINPSIALEPHQHESTEHVYFILSGVGIIKVGDEEQEVREGDAIYIPPQLTHAMRNARTYPLRFLTITAEVK